MYCWNISFRRPHVKKLRCGLKHHTYWLLLAAAAAAADDDNGGDADEDVVYLIYLHDSLMNGCCRHAAEIEL